MGWGGGYGEECGKGDALSEAGVDRGKVRVWSGPENLNNEREGWEPGAPSFPYGSDASRRTVPWQGPGLISR